MSDAISLCKKLVQFQSDNNNNREALLYLQAYLQELGFEAEIISFSAKDGKKVDNLWAKIGQGAPHLLFNGHIDVVPAGDLSLWNFPPYAGEDDGEYLYGRGISDMKGGIACFIAAVKEFLRQGSFKGAISLLISGDEEETIVDGTERLLEYTAAQGEKYDFAIVGEPSNPYKLGEALKIGRRGDVFFKIISKGVAGHTAYPQLAVNPVSNLVNFLHNLLAKPLDKGNAFFEPSTMALTTIDVKNPASNVIPSEAVAGLDVRFNSEHSGASLIEKLRQEAARAEGEFVIEPKIFGESFLSAKGGACEILVGAIREVCGLTPEYSTGGGTSDARFVKNYCQVIEFGLISESIHKTNERAKLQDIEALQKIYTLFLQNYFAKI